MGYAGEVVYKTSLLCRFMRHWKMAEKWPFLQTPKEDWQWKS